MYTHKMLIAGLATLICVGAQAQRDYPSQRDDARAQRSFDACVDENSRGRRDSRNALRSIEEQCRREIARESNRQPLERGRQRESMGSMRRSEPPDAPQRRESAIERRSGQELRNDESNTPGGTLRRKDGD